MCVNIYIQREREREGERERERESSELQLIYELPCCLLVEKRHLCSLDHGRLHQTTEDQVTDSG
jgi:hypothetical protein